MNDFLPKRAPRRHFREIPLAPVLDLLTVVVFFLLLSTSFIEFTKQTLPPSSLSVITDPSAVIPLSLKIFVIRTGQNFLVSSRWAGNKPGQVERYFAALPSPDLTIKAVREETEKASQILKEKFSGESNIQLGLGSNITYQEMIAVMDGVREHFDDLVMVSPQDTESKGP